MEIYANDVQKRKCIQMKKRQHRKWSKEEKSRAYFIIEGITGMGQFSLTTGAFLAGFVSFLGGSESLNGILGVVPPAAGMFQIFAGAIMKEGKTRKASILPYIILLRIFLSIVYFVPFLVMQLGGTKNIILGSYIGCFIVAYTMNSLIMPHITSWMIDVTPIHIRGRYLALRERISMLIIAVTTIVLGRVLDHHEAMGDEFIGFLIVGVILAVMGMLNIYAVFHIQEVTTVQEQNGDGFLKNIMKPIRDKIFQKIIIFYMLWNFALQIGAPYISVFMVDGLDLSYTYMMSMTVLGTIIRVIFAAFWGKIADRKSWLTSAKFSLIVLGCTHFSWFFVTPNNSEMVVPILSIMSGIAWAGAGISLFNVQFLYANLEIRTISIGVNAAIGGSMSLLAVNLGSLLMTQVGIRTTFAVSGVLLFVCALYIKLILKPSEMRNG